MIKWTVVRYKQFSAVSWSIPNFFVPWYTFSAITR